MDYVTSAKILQQLRIKSQKTLTRWHQRELIPPPEMRTHPSGRGRQAFWPEWVLYRCIQIRQLLREGNSLDDIAALLGNDWEEEERKESRKYRYQRVAKRMEEDRLCLNVCDEADNAIGKYLQHCRELLLPDLLPNVVVRNAISLMNKGYNPVLVVTHAESVAVPDFSVSHYLSEHHESKEPILILPFHQILSNHLDKESADEPTVRPSQKVVEQRESSEVDREVSYDDGWGFTLKRGKGSRKKRKGK